MKVAPGYLVRLKSGGPLMTVTEVRPDFAVAVAWFTDEGELKQDAFFPPELMFVRLEPMG